MTFCNAGADPRFWSGGAVEFWPQGLARPEPKICSQLPENCMIFKKCWGPGAPGSASAMQRNKSGEGYMWCTGVDPGAAEFWPQGALRPKVAQICLKTAWFWKNPGGREGRAGPLDPLVGVSVFWTHALRCWHLSLSSQFVIVLWKLRLTRCAAHAAKKKKTKKKTYMMRSSLLAIIYYFAITTGFLCLEFIFTC